MSPQDSAIQQIAHALQTSGMVQKRTFEMAAQNNRTVSDGYAAGPPNPTKHLGRRAAHLWNGGAEPIPRNRCAAAAHVHIQNHVGRQVSPAQQRVCSGLVVVEDDDLAGRESRCNGLREARGPCVVQKVDGFVPLQVEVAHGWWLEHRERVIGDSGLGFLKVQPCRQGCKYTCMQVVPERHHLPELPCKRALTWAPVATSSY